MPAQNISTLTRCIFTLLCLVAPVHSWAQSYTMTTFVGTDRLGDGKQATTVPLRDPYGVAQDAAGTMYIADRLEHRIRRVGADGVISTLAGTGRPGFTGDGGPATAAKLNGPLNLKLDGNGNLFICDYGNSVVRKINLTTGIITTVAGDGTILYSGENKLATQAALNMPLGVGLDAQKNVYIADYSNNRVRKLTRVRKK